jgi:RecA-family ATPase
VSDAAGKTSAVLSLGQLLEQQPSAAPACLVEPGLLPPQGILFVGGEPKVGKSLLVANLALSLAAGTDRSGFPVPAPRRVLICQFELPVPQFVSRLATAARAARCRDHCSQPALLHSRSG